MGPKLTTFLEQAGIDWPPARLVHVSLICFIAGFAVAWLMLPLGKPLAFLVALRGRWNSVAVRDGQAEARA